MKIKLTRKKRLDRYILILKKGDVKKIKQSWRDISKNFQILFTFLIIY